MKRVYWECDCCGDEMDEVEQIDGEDICNNCRLTNEHHIVNSTLYPITTSNIKKIAAKFGMTISESYPGAPRSHWLLTLRTSDLSYMGTIRFEVTDIVVATKEGKVVDSLRYGITRSFKDVEVVIL